MFRLPRDLLKGAVVSNFLLARPNYKFLADASWSKKTRKKWNKNTPARHADSSPSFFNKQTPLASKVIVRVHLMILTLRTQGSSSRKRIQNLTSLRILG